MLKIRLMRIGTKGRPFYRIVAVDERKKRTGGYLDLIGTYNPLTNPKEIKIDQTKVDEWVKKGAQLSDGFLRISGKAPQRPERKVRNPGKLRSNTPEEAKEEVASGESLESSEEEANGNDEGPVTNDESAPQEDALVEEVKEEESSEEPAEETKTEEAADSSEEKE